MFKTIVKFIKYNTMVTAIIAVGFVAVASVMAANEDVKKIIGEEIVEKSGVDNTVLLAADLDNFDLKMEITNALEDEENYYIDYQYNTLAIKDNVWREILKQEQIIVSKAALAGGDLGLYLMEELGEVIDYELAFLMEVQEKEEEKGVTVVLEKTEYTGLIGLVFNTKTKELPGYEPVVKPLVVEVNDTPQDDSAQDMEPMDNYDDFTGEPEENNYPDDAPVWDQLEKNCLDSDRFWDWDSKTCNDEEVVNDEEETIPAPPSQEEDPEDPEEEEELVEEDPAEDPVADEEPTEPADEDSIVEEPAEELVEDEESVEEPTEETEPEIEDLGNEGDQGDEEDLF